MVFAAFLLVATSMIAVEANADDTEVADTDDIEDRTSEDNF